MWLSALRERKSQYTARMDIRDARPIGTRCVRCDGQANVLIEEWTADHPIEETVWTCPRCHAANAISVRGRVVGVAFATGHIVSCPPR
jgi:bacterioferritin-associated ferredoxin